MRPWRKRFASRCIDPLRFLTDIHMNPHHDPKLYIVRLDGSELLRFPTSRRRRVGPGLVP